jgi:hypothetical protein
MFSNLFFRKSDCTRDTVEKYGAARPATDNNNIRRMRFACWITKAADTQIFIIYCFSTVTELSERPQPYVSHTLTVLLILKWSLIYICFSEQTKFIL